MKALLAVLVGIAASLACVGTALAQEPAESVEKHVCASSIGYSSLDALQQDLLLSAKRMAVDELFGELITASTTVDEFVVTSDEIRSSSLGLIRVDGSLAYTNGNNLAEVCIDMKAYVTAEDRAKFDPVALSKRYCEGNPKLTTGEIQERTRDNAIIQAVIEYDGRLEEIDPDNLRKLMQRVVYSESGFVPDTQTYCTTVSGEVVPIQVLSVLGGADLLPQNLSDESTSKQAGGVAQAAVVVPTTVSGQAKYVPFSADGDTLASDWTFEVGKASLADYVIEDGALRIVTGNECADSRNANEDRSTRVTLPLSGDFAVQVKVGFDPKTQYQTAGLFLSAPDDFTTRIGVMRHYNRWENGQKVFAQAVIANSSHWIGALDYVEDTTYLQITKIGNEFSLATSEFGHNWVSLIDNYVLPMPNDLLLSLFVYNFCNDAPIAAEFSEFVVLPPLPQPALSATGSVPLEDPKDSGTLAEFWHWVPGMNAASAFRVKNGQLQLVAGPRTQLWGGERTSPRVETDLAGDFVLEVSMNIATKSRNQWAGVYIRDESGHWVHLWTGDAPDARRLLVAETNNGASAERASMAYPEDAVRVRIAREGSLMTFAYSTDGETWETILDSYVTVLQEETSVGFFVHSNEDFGATATFSDLTIEAQ